MHRRRHEVKEKPGKDLTEAPRRRNGEVDRRRLRLGLRRRRLRIRFGGDGEWGSERERRGAGCYLKAELEHMEGRKAGAREIFGTCLPCRRGFLRARGG
jgi:hypothetical protein